MKKQKKLGTYLTVTAGVGCATTVAEAGVTFFESFGGSLVETQLVVDNIFGFEDPKTGFTELTTNVRRSNVPDLQVGSSPSTESFFRATQAAQATFGSNYVAEISVNAIRNDLLYGPSFNNGAIQGTDNFALLDFDGDLVFDALAQFSFDLVSGGRLLAVAHGGAPGETDPANFGNLPISGSAATELILNGPAAVPEPSSLSLLALGSIGLISRRTRKKAA